MIVWTETAHSVPGGTGYQHDAMRGGVRVGFVLELPAGKRVWTYEWYVGDGLVAGQAMGRSRSRDRAVKMVEAALAAGGSRGE